MIKSNKRLPQQVKKTGGYLSVAATAISNNARGTPRLCWKTSVKRIQQAQNANFFLLEFLIRLTSC